MYHSIGVEVKLCRSSSLLVLLRGLSGIELMSHLGSECLDPVKSRFFFFFFKEAVFWTGELASSVQCFLCKHDSLVPYSEHSKNAKRGGTCLNSQCWRRR